MVEPSDLAEREPATRSAHASVHEDAVCYPDRLVIAPAWGHFVREPLDVGQIVEQGSVIGKVQEGRREVPIVSPVRGSFVAWVATEGEAIFPREPVAWLRLSEA
jgi:biotin carboxyl carrier protein